MEQNVHTNVLQDVYPLRGKQVPHLDSVSRLNDENIAHRQEGEAGFREHVFKGEGLSSTGTVVDT